MGRRHLAGRRGGGRRGDGHEPPPPQRREQPGPRRGRVDGWRGAAAQHQERHRVASCALTTPGIESGPSVARASERRSEGEVGRRGVGGDVPVVAVG